jgi:hypothetical protein
MTAAQGRVSRGGSLRSSGAPGARYWEAHPLLMPRRAAHHRSSHAAARGLTPPHTHSRRLPSATMASKLPVLRSRRRLPRPVVTQDPPHPRQAWPPAGIMKRARIRCESSANQAEAAWPRRQPPGRSDPRPVLLPALAEHATLGRTVPPAPFFSLFAHTGRPNIPFPHRRLTPQPPAQGHGRRHPPCTLM